MAQVFYDNQKPVYRNTAGTTSMTFDSTNNQLIIDNTVIGKTITINSEEFSNGTQSLPYLQMYEKINACNASVYPAPNSTTVRINKTLECNSGTQTSSLDNNSLSISSTATTPVSIMLQGDTTLSIPAQFVITDNTNIACGIKLNGTTTNGVFSTNFTTGQIGLMEGQQLTYRDNPDPSLATTDTEITSTQMKIQDLNGAGTRVWTADAGSLNITDGASLTSYIDAGSATFTAIGSGQNTQITSYNITTTDLTYSSSLDNANLTFTDPVNNLKLQLTNDYTVSPTPFIQMTESSGLVNTFSWGELNANGHYCYTFNNNEKFFKQQNPFSFRQVELFDGDFIEKDYPFVMIQNGSTLKLRDPTEYLDDNGNAGWSCIVSNYGGNSIQIDIASASSWFAHSNGGGQANPIDFSKWSTARITLVYSSIDSQYVWAVGTF